MWMMGRTCLCRLFDAENPLGRLEGHEKVQGTIYTPECGENQVFTYAGPMYKVMIVLASKSHRHALSLLVSIMLVRRRDLASAARRQC